MSKEHTKTQTDKTWNYIMNLHEAANFECRLRMPTVSPQCRTRHEPWQTKKMSKLNNEQNLGKIYYDLERGYGSAKSLYEQAKEGTIITLEEVKNFMKKRPNQ